LSVATDTTLADMPRLDTGLEAHPPRRWHLLAVAVGLAVTYLFGVSNAWWPKPDSALYLSLGRSLARGEGFTVFGQPCTDVAPGLPAILAGLQLAFGPGLFAANLFMALCGLGTAAMTYLTLARLSDRRTAFLVALATGLSYSLFSSSHTILTDAAFALAFWAMLYSAVRYLSGSWLWLGVAAALAAVGVAIRPPGLTVLVPAAVGLMLHCPAGVRRRRAFAAGGALLGLMLAGALGFLMLALMMSAHNPLYLRSLLDRADIGWNLPALTCNALLSMPEGMAELLTSQSGFLALSVPIMLLCGVGVCTLWRRGQRLLPVLAVLAPLPLAIFGERALTRSRYLLPLLPVYLHISLVGLLWVARKLPTWRELKLARRLPREVTSRHLLIVATVYVLILVGVNVPRLSRDAFYYGYYSRTDRYYDVIRDGKFRELADVAALLRRESSQLDDAAVTSGQLSMLQYMLDRPLLELPEGRTKRFHANRQLKKLADYPDARVLVIETEKAGPEYLYLLGRKLRPWRLEYDGAVYHVYLRDLPAHAAALVAPVTTSPAVEGPDNDDDDPAPAPE
jgi:4-amino-4-deoxy-L-arabinose transferase-like glycosyltransferase